MDQRERINDLRAALLAALDGRQAQLWTALPATVVSYNAAAQTIQAQPTILIQYRTQQNVVQQLQMPVINDCPVVFPHGGGFSLTFPLQPGDECLLIFASRCIDGWWATSKISPQGDLRMHDLSDGFALVGPRSKPNALTGVSTTTVQLRSDDGTAYVEIDASKNVNVKTPGTMNITAPGGVIINGIPLAVP